MIQNAMALLRADLVNGKYLNPQLRDKQHIRPLSMDAITYQRHQRDCLDSTLPNGFRSVAPLERGIVLSVS